MRHRLITASTATPVLLLFKWILLDFSVLALLVSCCHGSANLTTTMQTVLELQYPPLFVFGDSLVANGNNKFVSLACMRADYSPYGIDFVDGPTGRFTNGRTVADAICDAFGLPYPPSSLDPSITIEDVIQKGANFASAGAGILDITLAHAGPRLPMNRQIEYFNATVDELNSKIGSAQSSKFLAKVVCLIVVGSNDFINNYWSYFSPTRLLYNPTQYNGLLLHDFGEQLKMLYNLGLRKIIIAGVPPLGHIPISLQVAADNEGDFIRKINAHVTEFNVRGLISGLLPKLARTLPGAKLLYADVYNAFENLRENAKSLGFKEFNKGCCKGIICESSVVPCKDRNSYAFWDGFHPTEAFNVLIIKQLLHYGGILFKGDKVFLNNLGITGLMASHGPTVTVP